MLSDIRADLHHCSNNNRRIHLITWCYNVSFALLKLYRISRFFQQHPSFFTGVMNTAILRKELLLGGCQISPEAKLGRRISFPHPTGIIIGAGVIIADDVTIYQHVTLGNQGKPGLDKRYPNISTQVTVYAGAKIIGAISVGENAVIGANAVVIADVPASSLAVGVPAKVRDHG